MKQYQLKPGYVKRNVAGEYLAIPVTMDGALRKQLILLNSVSAYIWDLLTSRCSVDELTKKITEEFEVSYQVAYQDTEEFLIDLEKQHLLCMQ